MEEARVKELIVEAMDEVDDKFDRFFKNIDNKFKFLNTTVETKIREKITAKIKEYDASNLETIE